MKLKVNPAYFCWLAIANLKYSKDAYNTQYE